MKKIIFLLAILSSYFVVAQTKTVKKPEYVIIVNDEIISKEKLLEYGEKGYVKSMSKGVKEEEKNRLAKKFGDKIGDREFIIKVAVFTGREKLENESKVGEERESKKPIVPRVYFEAEVNKVAEEFTVTMINGESIKLSDLKGKVILLNFWATWCAPCLMEFYDIPSKIIKPFKNDEFVFLPISVGESQEKVMKKMLRLKEDGISFNAGIDPGKDIWAAYNVNALPQNFLIDQNGVIKVISRGNTEDSLEKLAVEIKRLLKK